MNNSDLPRWATALALPLLNLLSALLVAALVIYLLGENPLESLAILINAALLNPEGLGYTLFYASTFIFTGLSVSVAMQAGLFNIGSEGQMYLGGLGITLVVLALDSSMPSWLLIPLAIMGSAVFGAAWAYLPGYLQAKRGSHIVVTTIMFNFIAASLMNFIIVAYLIPAGQQNTASRIFADSSWLPKLNGLFPVLGETPLNISFILALLGLLISGALAGLGAVNSLMGSTHYLNLNFPAGAGFIGIAIALMGRQHPIGILLSSILFGALIQGGFDLSLEKPNIPPETFIFIQGLIILFCGAMENLYAPAISSLLNATSKLSSRNSDV